MGWFSRRLPNSQKGKALMLVHHLQTMLAYQQLAMETYNDAAASVSEVLHEGDEVSVRMEVSFSSPALVAQNVIPALKKKIEILRLIEEKHRLASTLAIEKLQQPYEEMALAIHAMLDRANLQHQGLTRWVQSPQTTVDTHSLDRSELAAIDRAVNALNDLIFKKVGLTTEEWLDINWEAFNSVRASVGLSPLERDVFRFRYFLGVKGERARFFTD